MTLAEKKYKEDRLPDRDSHPIRCCNCLAKKARWYSVDGDKAGDCKDVNHVSICWLCDDCAHLLGVNW